MRFILVCSVFFYLIEPAFSRDARSLDHASTTSTARFCNAYHGVGRLGLYRNNSAKLWGDPLWAPDDFWCSRAKPRLNGEFPLGSNCSYLYRAGLWVGGVLGKDTLVTASVMDAYSNHFVQGEFSPLGQPEGEMQYRSTRESVTATSEEDYLATAADTLSNPVYPYTPDVVEPWRTHKPLHIEVRLRSYAWSSILASKFVLFDWEIVNIGAEEIKSQYIGIYADQDVFFRIEAAAIGTSNDDICGLLQTHPVAYPCNGLDTVNISWVADNDGDPEDGEFLNSPAQRSPTGVLGFHLLGHPERNQQLSYNWWITSEEPRYEFGPRTQKGFRPFANGRLGNPEGDRNAYFQLRDGEIDYDLVEMNRIQATDPGWMMPSSLHLSLYGQGGDVRALLSIGPIDLAPGESRLFPFAVVGGDGFHVDPTNGQRLLSGDIDGYKERLNFDDLVKNVRMADWVYDNPGVDTDSDGYAGLYRVCVLDSQFVDGEWKPTVADTNWYEGDGVPDWRAVGPPPPPKVWLTPVNGGIHVRFNGYRSEATPDLVTGIKDFEGYRVYLGRDEREGSLAVVAGYDRLNFDKYVYDAQANDANHYAVRELPFSLEALRCLYGVGSDPCLDNEFNPLAFTQANPYRLPGYTADSTFYFRPHDFNVSRLGTDTPIRKRFPDEPMPDLTKSIPPEAFTADGFLKYFEYECAIDGLLPTVPYYLNVTAFDFGDPATGVGALESDKLMNLSFCYAAENGNQSGIQGKPVFVYPNPYRTDANYRDMGYEGRGSGRIDDRERRIHFANLPAKCWIRIHTLDGDMVREIRHDMDPNDPASDHDTWDLINRNIMAVESGLYYWSVEPDSGPVQIGKLVIIR